MQKGFVALSAFVEMEGDEAVGAGIAAVGFQHFAQSGEGLFVLVQPSVGFTLKKEEGVALVGGEGIGGGAGIGGDCEGIDPLHEGAILSTAGEALGERDTRFAVVGTPREEGAQSLFGIVPLATCHQDFGDVEAQNIIACRIGIVGECGFERTLGGGE